ncbi:MAG: FG-GAP-like repeat-containing protein, partial [Limisphaerales bacterium]
MSILAGNGNATFTPVATVSTPAGPIALASGDVNGDGIADLLTANHTAHSVSVLIGNGNGTFQAPTNYSVGTNPRSVALGDLDGDGVLDFVTANTGGGNITIRRGNGDGSFGSATNIVTGARAHSVAIGDLNGDGFLDLAVANEIPNTVSVLLGNGDGTFAALLNLPVTSDPRSVVIADLNGDGAKDLAVIGGSTVSVIFGNGNGTFATPVNYATASSDPYQIIAADLDLDGDLDLAVANYGGRVTVLENNGLGVFSSPANYTLNGPISLAAGDYNGDGTLELAVANHNTHNVTILCPNMTQALAEDPVGSGIRTGAGRGNLSSSSDVDFWSFTGRAGDRLVVASENVGNFSHTGLRYRIDRPDGVQLTEFFGNAGSNNGSGQSAPVILPVSGTYYVRVYEWNTYTGEYRLRVTLAPAPWQLESEDNNTVNQANVPVFVRAGTNQWAKVLGYMRHSDPGDVFGIGNLSGETSMRASFSTPASSPLIGVLEVLNGAGAVVAAASPGVTNISYNVPNGQSGQHFVRVRAQAGSEGLFSQYLLDVQFSDVLPPSIVADTLPAEGSATNPLYDRFTLTFSEDMTPVSVNNMGNYELRSSGADGIFHTDDDVLWPLSLSANYTSGLTANYLSVNGALQPGFYRFTASTNLQDRSLNAMSAPYVRHFVIEQIPGFNTESEPNGTRATATPLPIHSTQPDLFSGAGRGYLRDGNDHDYWSFAALPGDTVVVAAQIPGNPANSGLTYTLFDPAGVQLFNNNAANNGLFQSAPLVLTNAGIYTVRVSPNNSFYSEYRVRVSIYRNGLQVERESNENLGSANSLTYVTNGVTQSASIGGYLPVSSDLDYFNLGTISAGKTLFLRTRQPGTSALVPVVSVYNSSNVYQVEAGSGRPSDGVAEVRIEQTGVYYGLVRSTANSAGLMSEYILDVLIMPTEDVSFPNLQVTELNVPIKTGLKSGDPFTYSYTVRNVGSLVTQVGLWFDRIVLSSDLISDDSDIV